MNTKRIIITTLLIAVIASIFTVTVYARRNYRVKSRPTNSPSSTPIVTPTGTPALKTVIPSPTKTPNPTPSNSPQPSISENSTSVYITYYGWNDNDPPGTDIAYPKSESSTSVHSGAGGVGTFDDPVTFAADPKIFSPGTKIYVPYIKKYVLMEDSCAGCTGKKHIDIWAGGNGQNEKSLLSCEDTLTRDLETVDINPQNGLEVNPSPLFDSATATCIN